MKRKTGLTGVLFLLALCMVIFSGPAWGGIVSCPDKARVGQLVEIVASDPGTWVAENITAIYSDAAGTVELGTDEAATTVYWRLPKSVSISPFQYTIEWTPASGIGAPAQGTINVYGHVTIKDIIDIELIYYPGLTETMTASGGLAPYTWTVIGPDLNEETALRAEAVPAATPYQFIAPSTGEFAGIHTIWASDGLKRVIDPSLTGTALEEAEARDNVEIYEFAWLDGDQFFIPEDSAPVTYTLTGAPTHPIDPETGDFIRDDDGFPVTMVYSFKIMEENTESSTNFTGLRSEYGYITLDNGNAPISGVLVVTYHPPTNPSSENTFWIRGVASEKLNYSVDTYEANIYDVWLGPITIRLQTDISGVIVDENKNPLEGVEVLLLAPTQYQTKTSPTLTDGKFSLNLPRNQRYYFQANKDGYVSRLFTSAQFDNDGGAVSLQASDPQNYINGNVDYTPPISGTDKLADGEIVTITLMDYNQAPAEVLAETKVVYANTLTTQAYRLDIGTEEILPGGSYALIAYANGYSCTKIFRITDNPATGFQIPFSMDLDMKKIPLVVSDVNSLADPIERSITGSLDPVPQTQGAPAEELPAPCALGGVAFEIRNSHKDLRVYADFRPGFIDTSVLSNTAVMTDTTTVKFSMESEESPINPEDTEYHEDYVTYAGGSQRMLFTNVYTEKNHLGVYNNTLVNDYGAIMTIPFDLLTVSINDFESGIYYVRRGSDSKDLGSQYGDDIPLSDILAIDYLGDGETGWVTFRAKSFSYYGVGMSSGTSYQGTGSYKWATFDRYELWGCFVNALATDNKKGKGGLLVALLLAMLAGGLAIVSKKKNIHQG
ncbi:MAG: carboxypeptidase regulatory-like domain-containing protein [Desulfatibacillum sp.]|nr:carboxypeptidase regulatory-like domain-containing protein [Desulfatibacillum sp.]